MHYTYIPHPKMAVTNAASGMIGTIMTKSTKIGPNSPPINETSSHSDNMTMFAKIKSAITIWLSRFHHFQKYIIKTALYHPAHNHEMGL